MRHDEALLPSALGFEPEIGSGPVALVAAG
jgi:hypothetical protein